MEGLEKVERDSNLLCQIGYEFPRGSARLQSNFFHFHVVGPLQNFW